MVLLYLFAEPPPYNHTSTHMAAACNDRTHACMCKSLPNPARKHVLVIYVSVELRVNSALCMSVPFVYYYYSIYMNIAVRSALLLCQFMNIAPRPGGIALGFFEHKWTAHDQDTDADMRSLTKFRFCTLPKCCP